MMDVAMLMSEAENLAVLDVTIDDKDLVLVRRFIAGEERAFDDLVARYQSYVYNVCLHMLSNPTDAEDIAQEVFVAIHKALPKFRMHSKVSTWIYRITINKCISHRRGRPPEVQFEYEECVQSGHAGDVEKRHVVHHLLQEMAPHYRAVLVLKYFHELSYEETGEVLGWSVEKVKCYLHRARNTFKRIYEGEMESEGSV